MKLTLFAAGAFLLLLAPLSYAKLPPCDLMSLMVCKCKGGELLRVTAWCPNNPPPYTWAHATCGGQTYNAYGTNPSQMNQTGAVLYVPMPNPPQPLDVQTYGYDGVAPDPDCAGPSTNVPDPSQAQNCPTWMC